MANPRLDSAVVERHGVRMESYLDYKAEKYVNTLEIDMTAPARITAPIAAGLLRDYADVIDNSLAGRLAAHE